MRKGHPIDVIIRKKPILQELSDDLPFERADIVAKSATIGALKYFKPGQLLIKTTNLASLASANPSLMSLSFSTCRI
jgi:hypothetical protein